MNNIEIELTGRDRIELSLTPEGFIKSLNVMGCAEMQSRLKDYVKQYGLSINSWGLPLEQDHISLMIKILILKAQGKWNPPVLEEEVCHCRNIKTKIVEMSIVAGAHDTESISRQTTAMTGCGTCKKDVESVLSYVLGAATT
jgi:bacterioferritin-associated ferredoxin